MATSPNSGAGIDPPAQPPIQLNMPAWVLQLRGIMVSLGIVIAAVPTVVGFLKRGQLLELASWSQTDGAAAISAATMVALFAFQIWQRRKNIHSLFTLGTLLPSQVSQVNVPLPSKVVADVVNIATSPAGQQSLSEEVKDIVAHEILPAAVAAKLA